MSDSESDSYSSEEDADYEPSDEDYSEDDVSELVKEDNLDEDEQPQKRKSLKKAGKGIPSRKRNQEGLCLQHDDVGEGESDHTADTTVDVDLKEKKKADDLWASFLSDVGQKPKPVATTPTSRKENILVDQEKLSEPQDVVKDSEKPKALGKVTITKVFDFAGEEVKVKRPSAIGNILGKMGGKKQKMSTLEKSKIDWEAFKEKEGISDELAIYNRGKEGYIERKAFLDRVDHRQFELERDIRLSNMKP
ncbi:craniofacial development protein 1 isoform X5 [Mustelus asterias]